MKLDVTLDKSVTELDAAVLSIAAGAKADKPLLIYFYSSKTEKKRDKSVPTKAAGDSNELAKALDDKKFNVQVALRFFNCYEIDVSNITKEQSLVLNEEKAPLLVICHEGKVHKTLDGGPSARIYSALQSFLRSKGFEIADLTKEVEGPLEALYSSERELYLKNQELQAAIKGKKTAEPKLEKLRKAQDDQAKTSAELKASIAAILAKYAQPK